VDEGKVGADGTFGHGAVERVFGGHEGVGGAVVAVDAIHEATLAVGSGAARRQGGEDRLRAVGVALLHPGDCGARLVRGDVFDVAEVGAVDSAQLREGIATAEVEDDDGLRFGVFFVVGKAGLDEQLFADKPGRGVAAFADFARGAETADGRLDGARIGIERDLDELLGAVNFGAEVGFSTGADVTLDTGYMGVGGDLVGGVFRMHDVAGLAAELWRVHVSRAAVAGN